MSIELFETANMVEQFRFPRSGKRRIRKKWTNNGKNWRPMRKALRFGGKWYCHPQFAAQVRKAIRGGQ